MKVPFFLDLKTKSEVKKGMVGQGEDEIEKEGADEEEKNEEEDFR